MTDTSITVLALFLSAALVAAHRIGVAAGRRVERREQDRQIADGIAHRKAHADAVIERIVKDAEVERAQRRAVIFDPNVPTSTVGRGPRMWAPKCGGAA